MKLGNLIVGLLVWSAILVLAYLGEHGYRSLAMAPVLPGLLLLLGIPIFFLRAVQFARNGRWGDLALCVSVAVIVAGSVVAANKALDVVRLHVFAAHHKNNAAFSFSLSTGEVRIASWGDNGFAGTSTIYTLVYDETGEILKPPEQRSEEWRRVVQPALENMIIADARHVRYALTGYYSVIVSSI